MPTSEMLVNFVPGEECRIAVVEDGQLEELYQERVSADLHVGNIYKGRVTNVEPSIQAAFIDFGLERNGFLHVSDLHPMYFPGDAASETERVGKKTPRRDRPPIQKCLKRGQSILVQVLKEGISNKGPTLTSYLSIPGRYLVMMPNMERLGVSRKVEDEEQRREMRRILDELDPPDGFGFILRTAGMDRTKTELKRDLAYLQRLWKSIDRRFKRIKVGEAYTESDLIIRTLRDVFTTDISRVVVDNEDAARRARDFLAIVSPRASSRIVYYRDDVPLFDRFGIESQISSINAREAPLRSGGSLVIEATEALVAIDVNSGKSRSHGDAETMAFKTNLEACDEICRQLRLRDLGGVIVNDLIDMRSASHRKKVEQRFRENLKKDRAKTRVLPISQFGILEMTRQRMRPSLQRSVFVECESCSGIGLHKSTESVVLDVVRQLALALRHPRVQRVDLLISGDAAFQLLNRRRNQLVQLEQRFNKAVTVRVHSHAARDAVEILAYDDRESQVDFSRLDRLDEPELIPAEELGGEPAARGEPIDDEPAVEQESAEAGESKPKRSRRRRRRGGDDESNDESRARASESSEPAEVRDEPGASGDKSDADAHDAEATDEDAKPKRRRRRGGRRRKKDGDDTADAASSSTEGDAGETKKTNAREARDESPADAGGAVNTADAEEAEQAPMSAAGEPASDDPPKPKRRTRSRRPRKSEAATTEDADSRVENVGDAQIPVDWRVIPGTPEDDDAGDEDSDDRHAGGSDETPDTGDAESSPDLSSETDGDEESSRGGRRRRGRRGGRRRRKRDGDGESASGSTEEGGASPDGAGAHPPADAARAAPTSDADQASGEVAVAGAATRGEDTADDDADEGDR